jgi:hypothetical protein
MKTTRESKLQIAKDIVFRNLHEMEYKCRSIARWLGKNEDEWESYSDLLIEIEVGRLTAIENKVWTKEEVDSWNNYLRNR